MTQKSNTNVFIISGSTGSGKSKLLNEIKCTFPEKTILVDDWNIFNAITKDKLIDLKLSRGQWKINIINSLALTVPENGLFIIDEPENSLNFATQDDLIQNIINSNSQIKNIIIATNSPAIIIKGFQNCIIDMSDLDDWKLFISNFN